eukprot:m.238077 g.238077  ORF g.238077 m.238077 type:complete len:221 (+) comp21558_c0_seq1:146-808(+)
MDLLWWISQLATLSTILLFLSGLNTVRKIRAARLSTGISVAPFLCAIINCVLWVKYGLLIEDRAILLVNAVGGVLNVFYLKEYYSYSADQASLFRPILGTLCLLIVLLAFVRYSTDDHDVAVHRLGLIACTGSVMLFASPLTSLLAVVRSHSTESMTFSFSIMSFIVSTSWSLYGHLTEDVFVMIPNILGVVLSCVQLSLFAIYPAPKKIRRVGDLGHLM